MPVQFYLKDGLAPFSWLKFLLYPGPGTGFDEVLGRWAAALLTLAIFSFLFSDNKFFKLAEHIFIGVGTGYQIARYFNDSIYDKAYRPLFEPAAGTAPDPWVLIPAILGALTLLKLIPKLSFWSRWPIAFVAGVTMGLAIITNLQSNVVTQVEATIKPFRFIDEAVRNHTWRLKTPEDERAVATRITEFAVKNGRNPSKDEQAKLEDELKNELVERRLLLLDAAARLDKSTCADRSKDLKLLAMLVKPAFKNQEEVPVEPVLDAVISKRKHVFEELQKSAKPVTDSVAANASAADVERLRSDLRKIYGEYVPKDGPEAKLPIEQAILAPAVVNRYAAVVGDGVPSEITFQHRDWVRVINAFLIGLGVLSGLVYFFFSKEHTGLVFGGLARIGVWFLMIAFGGSFGFTVMGRISLLIGRIQFLIGDWLHLFRDSSGIVPGF